MRLIWAVILTLKWAKWRVNCVLGPEVLFLSRRGVKPRATKPSWTHHWTWAQDGVLKKLRSSLIVSFLPHLCSANFHLILFKFLRRFQGERHVMGQDSLRATWWLIFTSNAVLGDCLLRTGKFEEICSQILKNPSIFFRTRVVIGNIFGFSGLDLTSSNRTRQPKQSAWGLASSFSFPFSNYSICSSLSSFHIWWGFSWWELFL